MKHDAWIAPGQAIDDSRNEACGEKWITPDPHFSGGRVCKEFNFFHALAKLIKHGDAATEQSLAVLRRLDALPVALEKTYAERVLQIRDRSRNRRLGRVQAPCRFPHAAELHGGHEDVQVVQLHAASDPITDLHGSPHIETAMV